MIVALCALNVTTKKHAAYVTRESVRFYVAIQIKLCRRPVLGSSAIGGKDFQGELVKRLLCRQ